MMTVLAATPPERREALPDPALQGLLLDIAGEPEEDGLYLILADFLEEHGDPHRAELIRLQREVPKLPPGEMRKESWQRVKKLIREHGPRWLGNPPAQVEVEFRAGRLYAQSEVEPLLADGAGWLRRQSLWVAEMGLRLRHDPDGELAQLAQAGWPAGLNVLSVGHGSLADAGVRHLAGLTNLRELKLFGLEITDEGLERLSGAGNLPNLIVEEPLSQASEQVITNGSEGVQNGPHGRSMGSHQGRNTGGRPQARLCAHRPA